MGEERLQRHLAAILAADMVGYSRLMGADEAGTISRLKAHRIELIDPKITEHNGRIVKTTGDGLLVEFGSAVDAVLCAVAVQRGMAEREAEVPAERRIAYRVGINLGEIVIDGDDILGDGVNIAARLEALAEPGGIRISDVVFKNVRGKLALGFADLGAQSVKNIADLVRVYRVLLDSGDVGKVIAAKPLRQTSWRLAAAGTLTVLVVAVMAVFLWPRHAPIPIGKPSIAVLSFANLSGDPQKDYLARGLSEDLITDISKISGLLVAAREASSRYTGSAIDLKTVGKDLQVGYIVTGNVRASQNVLRVSVRLVDTATGFNLWAERYDRSAKEIFALQDDIARKVVTALKLKLTPRENAQVGKRTTSNPAAYDLLLRARTTGERLGPKANAAAIALLERAVEIDPGFAQAYAELAIQHFYKWNFGAANDPALLDRAAELAGMAIKIDPSLAVAHAALGFIDRWRRRYDDSFRSLNRAINLDPNNGEALSTLGITYLSAGNPTEGLKYIRLARQRTTFEPWAYAFRAGNCYFYLNRLDEAERAFKSAIARNPRAFAAHRLLAIVYVEQGRMYKAREAIKEARRLNPRMSISYLKRLLPFKNPADIERQITAMRKLEFPE